MSIPFDMKSDDLTSMNALVYQGKNGELFLDRETGFLACVGRFFYKLCGFRDYHLDKIVSCFAKQTDIASSPIATNNLAFLCGKLAKGCGIDDDTYKKVLTAEKLLRKDPIDAMQRVAAESFLSQLSTDSSLQKQLGSFQAKLGKDLPEARDVQSVLERAQLTSRWSELGLNPTLFNNDYEGAKFLIKTRVIYSIIGYQNSTADGPSKHEIKVDDQNRMMIKKEGSYVAAADLEKDFTFDKEWQEIASKADKKERWNYFSPDGLVCVDRWLHPEFIPVEKLSEKEMVDLRAHAQQFYPEGKAPYSELPRDAVIQIFTNPRKQLPLGDFPLITRLDASFPVHAAIRIITSDGQVYSTGFGSTVEEDKYTEEGGMLTTINGMPTILDYEEFRKHEGRVVTSIPITTEACTKVLDKMIEYRQKTIRFNLAKQNCVQLAVDALDETGVKVNTIIKGKDFMRAIGPSSEALPAVGETVGKMKKTIKNITEGEFGNIPPELKIVARLVQAVFLVGLSLEEAIAYLPSKLATLFSNVLVYTLGGAAGSPIAETKTEGAELLENSGGLESFSKLIRNPLDLFNEDTSTLSHALPLIQWQLQQGSTAIHMYGKQPAMGILPPPVTEESEAKKKYLVQKYLTNFGIV
ncbi:MAG: hypothetical protein JSR46_00205 [Verrucomicrobia bacterium]|nr:hypothetical protein [Verrucomicrobiota bacterium]